MNDDMATSRDATPPKRGAIAIFLSFIAPGLGLVYVGRLMAGLVINLLFVLFVLLFVITSTLFSFFPVYPAVVLGLCWLMMSSLSAWRAVELIGDEDARGGRAFQHPLIYILIVVATFAAPLALTAHFTFRHLVTMVAVDDPGSFPQAQPGDHLIVDRTTYRNRSPQRGELVTLQVPGDDELVTLRVVGLPGEQIAMDGFVLQVDNRPSHYAPLETEAIHSADVDADSPMELWIEHNDDQRYVISSMAGVPTEGLGARKKLGDDEYFLLSDNRSSIDSTDNRTHVDSRHFGAVDAQYIEGRPLYVGWSTSPDADDIRWERIGLPVH